MNPADICRECELSHSYACSDCELPQKVQQLEQAGNRLSNLIIDVLDNIIDECALLDALEKWDKAKEEAE